MPAHGPPLNAADPRTSPRGLSGVALDPLFGGGELTLGLGPGGVERLVFVNGQGQR
jgi:hypothetical protein